MLGNDCGDLLFGAASHIWDMIEMSSESWGFDVVTNSLTSYSVVEGHAKYCDFSILYLLTKAFFKMRDSDIHIDHQHVFS